MDDHPAGTPLVAALSEQLDVLAAQLQDLLEHVEAGEALPISDASEVAQRLHRLADDASTLRSVSEASATADHRRFRPWPGLSGTPTHHRR